jgi:hypothetical protein
MRSNASNTKQISSPNAMRANTAKLKPAPSALHLMASGVVDQIRMTIANAKEGDIGCGVEWRLRIIDETRNACSVF